MNTLNTLWSSLKNKEKKKNLICGQRAAGKIKVMKIPYFSCNKWLSADISGSRRSQADNV